MDYMVDEISLNAIGKKFYIDGDSIICTSGGDFQVKELYRIISEDGYILEDFSISSFDDNTFIDSKVVSVREMKIDEPLYKVSYDVYGYAGNCYFYTYPEQYIYTDKDVKKIEDLNVKDILVHIDGYVNIIDIEKVNIHELNYDGVKLFEITTFLDSSDNLFLNNILFKKCD